MKILRFTFYFSLILAINTTFCVDQNAQETFQDKQKKLEKDYQEVLSSIKKCKELIASDKPFDKFKGRAVIGGFSQIAAVYEVHVFFNALLTSEKKKLTAGDQETISKYLASKSYSKENEELIANYLNCLLEEKSDSLDIYSPQQAHINISKKCLSFLPKIRKNMARENLSNAGISIDENDPFFKD